MNKFMSLNKEQLRKYWDALDAQREEEKDVVRHYNERGWLATYWDSVLCTIRDICGNDQSLKDAISGGDIPQVLVDRISEILDINYRAAGYLICEAYGKTPKIQGCSCKGC